MYAGGKGSLRDVLYGVGCGVGFFPLPESTSISPSQGGETVFIVLSVINGQGTFFTLLDLFL